MRTLRRVALLVEASRGSGRAVLRGVAEYLQMHQPWLLLTPEHRMGGKALTAIQRWRPDGIIARVENPTLGAKLRQSHIPTIDVVGFGRMPGAISFGTDQEMVGRMAFGHLRERGLVNFGYYGHPGLPSSDHRGAALAACAEKAGLNCSAFPAPRVRRGTLIENIERRMPLREQALAAWLRALPKPVGVLAFNDLCARQLVNCCIACEIAVPGEVAVVGVDNDEVICNLGTPRLSSVQVNNEQTGWRAASALDRLMAGEQLEATHTKIPPRGVIARGSTDVLAIADDDIAKAVSYIRSEACQGITVNDVVNHVAVSSATLRRRFASVLGQTVSEELARVRIQRACGLLSTTDMSLTDVAVHCGYKHAETFCRAFRRITGQTPGEYRKVTKR